MQSEEPKADNLRGIFWYVLKKSLRYVCNEIYITANAGDPSVSTQVYFCTS